MKLKNAQRKGKKKQNHNKQKLRMKTSRRGRHKKQWYAQSPSSCSEETQSPCRSPSAPSAPVSPVAPLAPSSSLSNIDCSTYGTLEWQNSSCYIDSTLVLLFFRSIAFVNSQILEKKIDDEVSVKLQNALQKLSLHIQKPASPRPAKCADVRKLFAEFENQRLRT